MLLGTLDLLLVKIMLDYMDYLYLRKLCPNTIQTYMINLRAFFKFLYADDSITNDPTRKIPAIKVPKKDINSFLTKKLWRN
jgi:site-specific recombinase XerD